MHIIAPLSSNRFEAGQFLCVRRELDTACLVRSWRPFDLSAFVFGFDKTIGGLPLPLSLASIGLPNCDLYSAGNVMIGPFLGDQWQFAFSIPSSAAHVGLVGW